MHYLITMGRLIKSTLAKGDVNTNVRCYNSLYECVHYL